jgi:opacity protein-like surface antigen
VIGAIIDSQGSVQLTGTSQRHEFAVAVGGAYKIAPGINLALEYQYEQKHQGAFNFNTSANGVPTGNDIKVQGLTFATIVNW